jgi:hypothetical protein
LIRGEPSGQVRLAGHFYHTTALGELVASLYEAGRPEYRAGAKDPAPGVASITAVRPQLKVTRLDQVVEVSGAGLVWVQSRCPMAGLVSFLAGHGLRLVGPGGQTPIPAGFDATWTAGRAVIDGLVSAAWVDVLTKDGQITKHPQEALPRDALIVLAALEVAPCRYPPRPA